MMHVLLDDGSVKHRNRQHFKLAGYVIFAIMLERQVNLTAELHEKQHESAHKPGTMLLDTHKVHNHCLHIYEVRFLFPCPVKELSPLPTTLLS